MLITRGRVLAQRFFDIAEEVNLTRAESCVRELSRRPRFVGSAKHIELPSPPLEMALGHRNLQITGHRLHDVVVRIYNTGAVVVTLVLDLPNPSEPESLVALAQDLAAAEDAITELARPIAAEIQAAIRPACKISDLTSDIVEDYTVFVVQQTEPPLTNSQALKAHFDIPRLLAADKGELAEQERQSLLHASYSYRPDDLVVVDWNSALVVDPVGAQEVAELLEFTVMQMLELRTYDSLVGRALDRVYKDLDDSGRAPWRTRNYPELSRRIMKLFVDVVEIAERVDNSVTFLGDTWLARLHGAAAIEFGIPRWQKQLRSKLEVMHQINKLLADQIHSQKSMRIELAIAGLIVIEVVLALFQ
jgi:hypothetical protein